MYHASAQGVDECMINVHYYYYNAPLMYIKFRKLGSWMNDYEVKMCKTSKHHS